MSMFWVHPDGKLKDSSGLTARQALEEFRHCEVGPITPYAVSSVERGMFMAHLNEAIEIAEPEDKDELLAKAEECLKITPYTNWSGD